MWPCTVEHSAPSAPRVASAMSTARWSMPSSSSSRLRRRPASPPAVWTAVARPANRTTWRATLIPPPPTATDLTRARFLPMASRRSTSQQRSIVGFIVRVTTGGPAVRPDPRPPTPSAVLASPYAVGSPGVDGVRRRDRAHRGAPTVARGSPARRRDGSVTWLTSVDSGASAPHSILEQLCITRTPAWERPRSVCRLCRVHGPVRASSWQRTSTTPSTDRARRSAMGMRCPSRTLPVRVAMPCVTLTVTPSRESGKRRSTTL